ncbi:unnamed protein product [Euphydryas editha]|uniref:E3 ubiquitin-protein ligase Topors n=1 Tax=Euphydryas editha TaxID=104508 RepID=A0AAU9USS7_EUPED|nr:unnamed protein product [Euphydryas editha]
MDTLSPAQDDSSGANPSSIKSDDSSPRQDGGRSSPPPKCAICLGTCRNKSFTDSCLHQFCFKCLLTWSKVKAECPLCKQNFRSIIHNVQSNHQYEEYMVEQRQTEEITERIDIDNNTFTTATRRFRYRTTLTLPRRETIAIQQLLLHYPMVADAFPPPAHRRRRSPASFRRTVYRYNLWARPLPDFTGRFRDCSPEFYRYNDSQMHRLVPWLNRELHYLLNENIGHISYVIARILELLPQYHINSSEFRETMQRYFGDRTEHFLHELYCFASTPYDMTGYDRNVQYTTDTRVSTMVNEVISSSESEASVDSDIVMISSSEPADPPPGPSRSAPRVPAPVYPHNYIPEPSADHVIPIETISQSDTDDDSSEVMVVGYIKPPQDRTPEVVDLLGSDSDVIVQEPAPAEPATSEAREPRPAPLVKLTLKRSTPSAGESDSDSNYTPSPPRRRRRLGSALSPGPTGPAGATCQPSGASPASPASTADTRRTTPSGDTWSSSPSSSTTSGASWSSSPSSSTDYVDSDSSRTEHRRRKSRRKVGNAERNRRKQKKKSYRRSKKSSAALPGREKRNKRKSHSGKGVKSSKKSSETPPATVEPAASASGQPGTSETVRSLCRRLSRETKRLRSVVNVINNQKNSGESSSSSKSSSTNRHSSGGSTPPYSAVAPADADHSDSEDDLPLNLSIANAFSSL